MKFKNLLLLGGLSVALFGCTHDDVATTNPTPTPSDELNGTLELDVSVAQLGPAGKTRAVDSSVLDGAKTNLNMARILLLSNLGHGFTVSEIKDLLPSYELGDIKRQFKSFEFTSYGDKISSVAITANMPTKFKPAIGISLDEVKKELLSTSFDVIQPGLKSEDKDGVKNVPLYGVGSVKKITDRNYLATLTLKPQVARIQVYNTIAYKEELVEDVKITRLFLDNFIEHGSSANQKFSVGRKVGQELDNVLSKYKRIFEINDLGIPVYPKGGDKVYAYHVFPQKATNDLNPKNRGVRLILKIDYFDKVQKKNRSGYATLRLTKYAIGKDLEEGAIDIDPALLYSIDLGVIDWDGNGVYEENPDKFEPGFIDETPNAIQQDLAVAVEVIPWQDAMVIPTPY